MSSSDADEPGHRPVAVFRADASPTIGGGHVTRCLALAGALRRRGFDCRFLTNLDATAVVPALATSQFELVLVDAADTLATEANPRRLASLMIVDHYELDVHFESAARAWAQSIVVIDDFPGRRHDCDILIDPTPGRLPLVYSGVVSKRAALLLGVEYYMVGEAFRLERPTALARRRQGKEARDLLIACGATDPSNLTRRALDELRDVAWASQITVVLSAAAPHLQSVRDAISHLQTRARLVVDASASEIAALYSSADLAIGAAGVSTYERCCLGLPTIMVVTADNQRDNAAATEAAGAVHFLGDARSMARGDLAKAVTALAGDPKRLRKMADSASALCDGAGADRVADIIRDRI